MLVHTDAVQAVGKIPIDLKSTHIDMLSLSGHKLHAPKGVGVLYLKRRPENFDPHKAAAAGLVFHTAWHSLITIGELRPGETVLVVGASGGVNTARNNFV